MCPRVTGTESLSEPEHLKSGRCGGWRRTVYSGHQVKDHRPTCVEPDPQRRAVADQSQEQAEETDGEHGKVPGARPMIRRMLVGITHPTGRGLVLRCVLRFGALRRVADQVQSPEGPVAEEQRADQQHGQPPDVEQLHRRIGSPALDIRDGILELRSKFIVSVVVVAVVLVPSYAATV